MFQVPKTPFDQLLANISEKSNTSTPKGNKLKSHLVCHLWSWLRHLLFGHIGEVRHSHWSSIWNLCECHQIPSACSGVWMCGGGHTWLSFLCVCVHICVSMCLSMCPCQFCFHVLISGFLWGEPPDLRLVLPPVHQTSSAIPVHIKQYPLTLNSKRETDFKLPGLKKQASWVPCQFLFCLWRNLEPLLLTSLILPEKRMHIVLGLENTFFILPLAECVNPFLLLNVKTQ